MTRTAIRPEIVAVMPRRMSGRPVNAKGYPVPFFASKPDGVNYDLRIVEPAQLVRCVQEKLCWICGERLGVNFSFVIGPMCAVNRLSSEPPQHRECSIFAATVCPFLTLPKAMRRDSNMPEKTHTPDGMLLHNPGACAVWSTRGLHLLRGPTGSVLFNLGEPTEVLWYAHGRIATREEVLAAIDIGLPKLREAAQLDGGEAPARMEFEIQRAMAYLPPATVPVEGEPARTGSTPCQPGVSP